MPHKEDNFFEAPMKKLAFLLVIFPLLLVCSVSAGEVANVFSDSIFDLKRSCLFVSKL